MEGISTMVDTQYIEKAKEHFGKIVTEQLERVERMKAGEDWVSNTRRCS